MHLGPTTGPCGCEEEVKLLEWDGGILRTAQTVVTQRILVVRPPGFEPGTCGL